MKAFVFCIRDVKAGFLQPTVEVNASVAVRNFEHAILRNEDSLFFSHPEDYSLYLLGTFDTDSGVITPGTIPEEVITASDVISAALAKKAGASNG